MMRGGGRACVLYFFFDSIVSPQKSKHEFVFKKIAFFGHLAAHFKK
jgi:hypothetical protein